MKNFLIGMPGGFNDKKYARDFRKDFFGIEACSFDDKSEVEKLVKKAHEDGFSFGVHFPLVKNSYKCRDPLLLARNEEEREEAFLVFEEGIKYAAEMGAQYVLTHFPKPVILNPSVQWKFWRFGNDCEWIWEYDYPFEELRINADLMFCRLSELSEKYNITLVLENDAFNRYFYETSLLPELFEKYPRVKACLDIGRLHLLEQLDSDFDGKECARMLAPYTYILHLWNVKVENNAAGGHYPPLPTLRTEDGWGDMESYLSIIAEINRDVKVLFEHDSSLISDEELEGCYRWIDEVMSRNSNTVNNR